MVEIPGGKIEFETSPFLTTKGIKLEIERKLEWELLNEHLRSTDPLKKTFSSWKKSLASHIQARIDFKRKLAAALIRETGLKILERPSVELKDINSEAPFIDPYAVDVLTQELLSRLINPHEAIDFPDIITIADDGRIRYSNAPLMAYTPQYPDKCKAGILRVIYQRDISHDMGLIDTYRTMEEATGKAKRAVQELLLLGLVPGRCRICRRLGM
jgi:hypothetical protein